MQAADVLDRIVPISDFNRGKATAAFNMVEDGKPIFVMRRNSPAFVVITPEDYRRASEAQEDAELLALALARTGGFDFAHTFSAEESMAEFGITQADLDAMPEVEFE